MSWFSKPKPAKAAPAKARAAVHHHAAPAKGISKDGTRAITQRIEEPVSEKGKFYLKPLSCKQAWQFAERGGVYEMAANGVDDETIARRSGLSLFDVRRAIAGPMYRQVDVQELRKGVFTRKLALLGWDENALPDESNGGHLYMSDDEIIRQTGLIPDPVNHFILRWDHGGKVFMTALRATGNPRSPDHNKMSCWWDKAKFPPNATQQKQIDKLRRMFGDR